ncbi:MAG: trypsin-like peptidase domain-containing protein [Planctomycetes bacterium]|nr:trypsin-like peptidase domain-containing protein [Planctomycetota bacterium]
MNDLFPRRATRLFAGMLLGGAMALPAQSPTFSLLRPPELTDAERAVRNTPTLQTFQRAGSSVVHVLVKIAGEFRVQRDSSGVTISSSGLVLTNLHLVRDAFDKNGVLRPTHKVMVRTAKGEELPAKVIGQDGVHDLALLQVGLEDGTTLPAVEVADSRKVSPGETLLVVARPDETIYANFVGSATVAQGPVVVVDKPVEPDRLLLSDANMKRQADGGGVFDVHGRLVAIVNSSKVRPPAGKDASEQEKLEARNSFGFALRTHVAFQSFAKALARVAQKDDPVKPGLAGVARQYCDAVVSVRDGSLADMPKPELVDPYGKFANDKLCSGVLVDPSGLVLTSAHVAVGEQLIVTLRSGKVYRAKTVAKRAAKNVALLRLELPKGEKVPFVALGDSDAAILGERVIVLGNRYGSAISASVGLLSSLPREGESASQHRRSAGYFQTGAYIHGGNSGGPLLGRDGMLLGIADSAAAVENVEMKASHDAEAKTQDSTLGFALPSNWIREAFRSEFGELAAKDGPLCATPKVDAKARENTCGSGISRVVAKHADCFLNVFVKTQKTGTKRTGFMSELFPEVADDKDFRLLGQGSGVIIDPTGLALTNWHVVDAAVYADGSPRKDHKVFVSLGNGKKYEVEVLSTSRGDDLALLQLRLGEGEQLQCIRLGDSDAIAVGETAIAVGNPHGFSNSVTAGVVSAKGRDIMIKGRARLFRGLLQTDAGINPGNSGGALIDLNGDLIGINSAGDHSQAKIGFAIPVNYVRAKFHSTLLSSERMRSVFLGMEASIDQKGRLFVKAVTDYGPAAEAGVKVGDLLLSAQGEKLSNKVQLVKMTRGAEPFVPFRVELQRGDQKVGIVIHPLSDTAWTIFKRANFAAREVTAHQARELLNTAWTTAYREHTGDTAGEPPMGMQAGLLVTQVHPDAVAGGLDMKKGDVVIGVRRTVREIHLADRHVLDHIRTLKALRDFVRANSTKEGKTVELWTVRGDKVIRARVTLKRPPPDASAK